MATYAELIKQMKKDWDCPELMDMAHAPRGKKLPFSSPLMNYCTYGGIPRNKITEFYGVPGGGKTTTSIDICKNAYKIFKQEYEEEIADLREKVAKDKKKYSGQLEDLQDRGIQKVVYIDLENSFDDEWANTLGIKSEEIDIMTPPNVAAEDILQRILDLIQTGQVGLLVLDSIPSLVTGQELDKKIGERTVASLAGELSVFFRKVVSLLTRYKCTLLTINQIRDNLDNPYVVKTPGGQAPKFYASLRIEFNIGSPIDILGNELPKKAENPAGYIINAKIVKQKSAKFDRKLGSYYLIADSGIREDFDFTNLAINKYDIIHKKGGWFSMCDPSTGEIIEDESGNTIKVNGLGKVYQYLHDNQDYYLKLKNFILNDINGTDNLIEGSENVEVDEDADIDLSENTEESTEDTEESSSKSFNEIISEIKGEE